MMADETHVGGSTGPGSAAGAGASVHAGFIAGGDIHVEFHELDRRMRRLEHERGNGGRDIAEILADQVQVVWEGMRLIVQGSSTQDERITHTIDALMQLETITGRMVAAIWGDDYPGIQSRAQNNSRLFYLVLPWLTALTVFLLLVARYVGM
jgi:hypothetical protein